MPPDRSRILLLALSYTGFVALGLPDGLLGVATPSIRATFGLAPEDLGSLLLAFTAGYLLSSASSGLVVARLGVGTLLAASCLTTAASLLGYATAPAWWAMLGCGVLAGLGAGAIDAGLNTWVATHQSARTVNWLHGFYGVGASAGPLVMTAVLAAGQPWRAGYALVGFFQLTLALCFAVTRHLWSAPGGTPDRPLVAPPRAGEAAPAAARMRATLALAPVWLGVFCFALYTGIEATVGVWAYSMLTEARGVPAAVAGVWVSLFWLGLTLGRFAFGFVADHARLLTLLRASLAVIALGAALLALDLGDAATVAGLVLCGLAMAPIFPSLIATTPKRVGPRHTGNAVGFQVSGAVLGASLVPAFTGVLVGRLGLEVVGPVVLAGALGLIVLHEILQRAARGGAQPSG